MEYVCDVAGGRAWFRIETEAEAVRESELMGHAVEKHFRRAEEQAAAAYDPGQVPYVERDIGRAAHIRRSMPMFMTLRDGEGAALVTAMLPPGGKPTPGFRPIVVGRDNGDPYPGHADAIQVLGRHYGLTLDRDLCYPYRR
jgi:hypothetical protein